MLVVADSSPLIGLCRIGMLHLLRETFKQVIVPESVWREITLDDRSKAGVQELLNASWIERRTVAPSQTFIWFICSARIWGQASLSRLCWLGK